MPVYFNSGKNHQEKTDSEQKKNYFKKKRRDKKTACTLEAIKADISLGPCK